MRAIYLALIDLVCLGALFWFLPRTVVKLLKGKLRGVGFKPLQVAFEQLPGAITGTAAAALIVYLFGMSYEDFAVRQARNLGEFTMKLLGVDEVSQCKTRLTEKYHLSPLPFMDNAASFRTFDKLTYSEQDMLYAIGGDKLLFGDISPGELLDASLAEFCVRYGLKYGQVP